MSFDRSPIFSEAAKLEDIVTQLENTATRPDCGSRENLFKARKLRSDLFAACGTHPSMRQLRVRGAAAFRSISTAGARLLETEAAGRAKNLHVKKRIVAALEAASASNDPLRFVEDAKKIRDLFRATGSGGKENEAVRIAVQAALAGFWTAVREASPKA